MPVEFLDAVRRAGSMEVIAIADRRDRERWKIRRQRKVIEESATIRVLRAQRQHQQA